MWVDPRLFAPPPEVDMRERGRPHVCSDAVVRMLPDPQEGFQLPLCGLQGFALSLRKLTFSTLLDAIGGDGACNTQGATRRSARVARRH